MHPSAQGYYERGHESGRLAAPTGVVEFERTQEIVLRHLPQPPAVVADIGGGPGAYAIWLAALGYTVTHRDLMPLHVEQLMSSVRDPARIQSAVADARDLDLPDLSVDAVLLLGPLYHLDRREDRLAALGEALRVLRRGGHAFVAAISRWAPRTDGVLRTKAARHRSRSTPVGLSAIPSIWRVTSSSQPTTTATRGSRSKFSCLRERADVSNTSSHSSVAAMPTRAASGCPSGPVVATTARRRSRTNATSSSGLMAGSMVPRSPQVPARLLVLEDRLTSQPLTGAALGEPRMAPPDHGGEDRPDAFAANRERVADARRGARTGGGADLPLDQAVGFEMTDGLGENLMGDPRSQPLELVEPAGAPSQRVKHDELPLPANDLQRRAHRA